MINYNVLVYVTFMNYENEGNKNPVNILWKTDTYKDGEVVNWRFFYSYSAYIYRSAYQFILKLDLIYFRPE